MDTSLANCTAGIHLDTFKNTMKIFRYVTCNKAWTKTRLQTLQTLPLKLRTLTWLGVRRYIQTLLQVAPSFRKTFRMFNLLKPKTYFMYHQLYQSEILCSAHSAFICFAWISEQTAIISLYSINLSVFITEAVSVSCVVRNGSSNQTDTVNVLNGSQSVIRGHSTRSGKGSAISPSNSKSAYLDQERKWCPPWRNTHTLPRRSLLYKCNTASRYLRKCIKLYQRKGKTFINHLRHY